MLHNALTKIGDKILWKLFNIQVRRVRSIKLNAYSFKLVDIPGINKVFLSEHEPWMIDVLKITSVFNPNYFFDIGVNLGQTLLKVKSVFRDINYVGFEPNPTCVYYVDELLKLNCLDNCTIVPVGINKEDALLDLEFFNNSSTDSAASIVPSFRVGKIKSKIVPTFCPSNISIFKNLSSNDRAIIKIDVEGAELEVILGLREVIEIHSPIILLEILPVYAKENKARLDRQEELERVFRELNYDIIRIIKDKNGRLLKFSRMNLIGVHENLSECDYIAIERKLSKIMLSELDKIIKLRINQIS